MMYLRNRTAAPIALSLLLALLLASCTGNGSSGSNAPIGGVSLSPLVVAGHVSVVDPQGGSGKPAGKAAAAPTGIKALLLGLVNMSTNPLPSTSDYVRDVPMTYVNERSTEAFQEINNILCSVKQSRYDVMINQGAYLALIDNNLCSNNAANSTGESSGSVTPDYSLWTVKSSRASETAPHIVDVWLFDPRCPEGVPCPNGQMIVAQMTITEGADTAPPYGKFQINWITMDPVSLTEMNRGMLRSVPTPATGEALLQFAEETPDFSTIKKATLIKNAGDTGGGTVLKVEGINPQAVRFDIAFNPTHFLRRDYDNIDPLLATRICLDRINFAESAWSYGLYDQAGMRVNLNSGFSFKRGSDYGWVGYWGLWLPPNADGTPGTITNGETVYQHDFSTGADTPYTVFQAGGKLKKHTKKTLTLQEIQKVPIFWSDFSGVQYAIVWDNTTERFWKAAVQVFDAASNNWYWVPFTPAAPDPAALVDLSKLYSMDISGWSQALGGQVRVPLNTATTTCTYNPTNGYTDCNSFNGLLVDRLNAPVVFYAENLVYPGEAVPQNLDCYDNCPQADTAAGITNPDLITWANTWNQAAGISTPYTYTFNSMLLSDGTGPVIITTAGTNNQWGVSTGALIDPNTPNLAALLDCNWDGDGNPATNVQVCGWKAGSELQEFYTWETGPNNWNKFTGLQDSSGTFVRFDAPLLVQYVHHAPTNPTPADIWYDGVTFNLEYNGFGNLQGIPGECVNMDDGSTQPCGPNTRWVPEFTIPDVQPAGAPNPGYLTEVTGPSAEQYIVKALSREQRMIGLPLTDCTDPAPAGAGLDTGFGYPLPSMTLWKMPTSGPLPSVTTAPKVIGGVVQ